MKKLLLLLSLIILNSSGFAQTKLVKVRRTTGARDVLYLAYAPYNVAVYPQTVAGKAKYELAASSGTFSMTTQAGCIIPAGVRPPVLPPDCSVIPNWISAWQTYTPGVKYQIAGASGDALEMKFERADGTPITSTNPDGVIVNSAQWYGSGPLSGKGAYTQQWQLGSGAITAGKQLRLTWRKAAQPSVTFAYTYTPTEGTEKQLFYAGNSSPPPPPAATISYKKIFIFGNSITSFSLKNGELTGYDASAPDKDFRHILANYLRTLDPTAETRHTPSFAGGLNCGGSQLNSGDGGNWEQTYWTLPGQPVWCGFTGADSLDRFQAIANWQPDLIIIRVAENVVDNTHNFAYHYKRLVDKFRSQNPTAQIVTSTSDWQSLSQTQVTTSNIIKNLSTAEGWPCAELAGITGATAGLENHPNDAAMQTIADRIWAVIPKFTSGAGSLSNKPIFDTFDYAPITTNTTWPDYDNTLHQGVPIGEKVVMQNSQIRCEVWKNFGGSVGHISAPNGANMINQNDWGRGTAYTVYLGGRLRYNESRSIWLPLEHAADGSFGIGNNPIQIGDIFRNPSVVTQLGRSNDGTKTYTKTRMMNWQADNDPSDMTLEQWTEISNNTCPVHVRLTNNRTGDHTQYEARSNEYPQMIVTTGYSYNAHANSSNGIEYTAGGGDVPQDKFDIYQNWYGMMPDASGSSVGVGLFRPGLYTSVLPHRYAPNDPDTGQLANPAVYSAADQKVVFDWNGQWFANHTYVVGTASQIKTVANATADPRNTFAWKFNTRNGRGWFFYGNARDTGYPTPETGITITPISGGNFVDVHFPAVAIAASSVATLYIRYKAGSSWPTSGIVKAGRVGQTPLQYDNQQAGYSLVCDDTWRTATIPVSSIANSGWSGTMAHLQLTTLSVPTGATLSIQWINTTNTDPQP